jgi:hypothetical protein
LKTQGFPALWSTFADAKSYVAWQFVYTPYNQALSQQLPHGSSDLSTTGGGGAPLTTDTSSPSISQPEKSATGSEASEASASTVNLKDHAKTIACQKQRAVDIAECTKLCKEKVYGMVYGPECLVCNTAIGERFRACLNE